MRFIVEGDTLEACKEAGIGVKQVLVNTPKDKNQPITIIEVPDLSVINRLCESGRFFSTVILQFHTVAYGHQSEAISFVDNEDEIACRLQIHSESYCDSDWS